MSIISKLGDAFTAITKTDIKDKVEQIEHDSFTGSRFVALILAMLGLYWVCRTGVASELISYGFWLVIAYMVCNTITRSVQMIVNASIHRDHIRYAGPKCYDPRPATPSSPSVSVAK